MPQIFMWLSPGTQALFTDDDAKRLGNRIMPLVRQAFLDTGSSNDTTFSAKRLDAAENEADIQVIIHYMARKDPDTGSWFDPIKDQREDLFDSIKKEFKDFIEEDGLPDSATLSVSFDPSCGGYYGKITAKEADKSNDKKDDGSSFGQG
jgi:hypothetical protein